MAAVSFTGSRCALRRDAAVATSVVGSTPRLVAFRRLAHGDASTSTSLPERRPQVVVKASANGSEDAAVSRRQALSAAAVASLLAMNPGEAKAIRTTSMGTHENGDPVVSEWNEYKGRPGAASTYQANVEHRAAFSTIVADKVKDAIKPAEAAAVLKLAFLDASTYKPVNWATYGVNGSIRFEKGLMEKEGVAGVFAKLEKVKADVDSAYASYAKDQQARLGDSASPAPDKISYADLIAMSAAVAVEQKWVSERGEVDEALALRRARPNLPTPTRTTPMASADRAPSWAGQAPRHILKLPPWARLELPL